MWITGSAYPALVGEDPAKHAATVAESRSFSYNGGRHWVVPANTDTHENTHSKEVPELIPSRTFEMVWQADDENHTNNHDDHFLSVDKPPAEGITQETERELSNNVTDICCRVYCTSKEEWIGRALLSLQTAPISTVENGQCKFSRERAIRKGCQGSLKASEVEEKGEAGQRKVRKTYSYVQTGVTKLMMKRS